MGLFLAGNPGARKLDFDVVIRVEQINLQQVLGRVAEREIIGAKTIAALHHAHVFLMRTNPRI